jgi:PAS domain-containing protein
VSQTVAFSLVYAAAAAFALGAFAVVWPRRHAPGGTPLALLLLAAGFWAACDAVELYLPTPAGRELVSQFQYFGVIAAGPFFFHAAVTLSGYGQRLSAPIIVAVWAVPIVSLLLAWSNPWHRLIWTSIELPASGAAPFAFYRYGAWFWVLTAHQYLLMVVASLLLLRGIRRVAEHFRPAMFVMLLAVVLPWIGNAAYNLKLGPWPGFNWLTLALGISGSLLAWVVMREGLLDLLPQAREAMLETMTDGVVVLDRAGRIIDANQTARTTLELDERALAVALDVPTLAEAPWHWRAEAEFRGTRATRWLDVRIDPIMDRWGKVSGRLIVARDVTLQKALEDERERLIDELQQALGKVTQLEGLLPICANCRQVRDDGGYWGRIEDYLGSRSAMEFTHAICPDCTRRLYPELH